MADDARIEGRIMNQPFRFQELGPDSPWLLKFLEIIRERPAMYLGDSKVCTLNQFLNGYTAARGDLGLDEYVGDEVGLLDGFTHWLAVTRQTRISCQWAGIIQHEIDESEQSIQTFFKLFDQYREALKTTSLAELESSYQVLFRRR